MNAMVLLVLAELGILGGLYYWYTNQKNSFIPLEISTVDASELTQADKDNENVAWEYLDDVFKCWGKIMMEDREEKRLPDSQEDISVSIDLLNKVRELEPTNPDIINRANELGNIVNETEKRVFQGSRRLLYLCIGGTLVMFSMAGGANAGLIGRLFGSSYFWFFGGLYYFASMTPVWLLEKKKYTNVDTGFLYRLTDMSWMDSKTTYVDGWGNKVGTSYNSTGSLITIVLWLFIFAVNLMLIPVRAGINGLRNYVFLK